MSHNIPTTFSGVVSSVSTTSIRTRPTLSAHVFARQSNFDHDPESHLLGPSQQPLSSLQVRQRLKAHVLNRQRSNGSSVCRLKGCVGGWSASQESAGVTSRQLPRASGVRWSQWRSADSANSYDTDSRMPEDHELTAITNSPASPGTPHQHGLIRQSSERPSGLFQSLSSPVDPLRMVVEPLSGSWMRVEEQEEQEPSRVSFLMAEKPPGDPMDVQMATALAVVNVLTRLNQTINISRPSLCSSNSTTVAPSELRKSVSESYLFGFGSNDQPTGSEFATENHLTLPFSPRSDRLKLQSHASVEPDNAWTGMDWEPGSRSITSSNTPSEEHHQVPESDWVMPKIDSGQHQVVSAAIPESWRKFVDIWESLPVDDWSCDALKQNEKDKGVPPDRMATALAFDRDMLEHRCMCSGFTDTGPHAESPNRLAEVLANLTGARLHLPASLFLPAPQLLHLLSVALRMERRVNAEHVARVGLDQLIGQRTTPVDLDPLRLVLQQLPLLGLCRLVRARMATEEELCAFHSPVHVVSFGCLTPRSRDTDALRVVGSSATAAHGSPPRTQRLSKLACGGLGVDSDTVWNPETTAVAARLAVGQVLCLAHKVAAGELRNGFALVRPPGHHAEPSHAMGFCYFNSVAVASLSLLRSGLVSRVLILDWDIHHGNGTSLATREHSGLLYISLHRHDNGTFFPGTGGTNEGPPAPNGTAGNQHGNRSRVINIAWQTNASCEGETSRFTAETSDDLRGARTTSSAITTAERRRHWLVARQSASSSSTSSGTGFSLGQSSSISSVQESVAEPPSAGWSTTSFASSSTSSCLESSFASSSCFPLHDDRPQQLQQSKRLFVPHGDAEYLAAMRSVVLPVAREFQPEIILISAGFDAASGHDEALGGYLVSPGMFAWMTRQCMSLVDGRVVLALEGGYAPLTVEQCVTACLNALLLPVPSASSPSPPAPQAQLARDLLDTWTTANEWISAQELQRAPCFEAVASLMSCARQQAKNGWRCLAELTEEDLSMSFVEAAELERQRLLLLSSSSSSNTDQQPNPCSSPLTDDLAKLCMNQN